MKKLHFNLDNFHIKKKLFIIYVISFFFPVMLFILFINFFIYNISLNNAIESVNGSLDQIQVSFRDIIENVGDLSDRLYLDPSIPDILANQYKSDQEAINTIESLPLFYNFLSEHDNLAKISIFNTNMSLPNFFPFISTNQHVVHSKWYQKAIANHGKISWNYQYDRRTNEGYLSIIRSIIDKPSASATTIKQNPNTLGVLSLTINPDKIRQLVLSSNDLTLLFLNNELMYTSVPINTKTINSQIQDLLENYEPSSYSTDRSLIYTNLDYQGKKALFFIKKFTPNHGELDTFEFVFIIPELKIMLPVYKSIAFCFGLLFAISLISFLSIIKFSYYIENRVSLITNELHKVIQQDFNIQTSIGGNDEFTEIYQSIVSLTQNTKLLINEVYLHKVEQQQLISQQNEIRFKMLSSQINPHFLFNTLETIRMTALAQKDKKVADTIKILAKILRYNLSVTEKLVPLSSEIQIVSYYLEIQHLRFGNRICYNIQKPDNLQNISILPLLIQPIVENALTHGLHANTDKGLLSIVIKQEQVNYKDIIRIIIQDNGKGIAPKKLSDLKSKIANTAVETFSESIGLVNVQQRIHLYYGNNYGLEIKSIENEGTTVAIEIPFKEFCGDVINV